MKNTRITTQNVVIPAVDQETRYTVATKSFTCTCGGTMVPVGGMYSNDHRASFMPVLECETCKRAHDLRLLTDAFKSTPVNSPMFAVRWAAMETIWGVQDQVEEIRDAMKVEESSWDHLLTVADRELDAEETPVAVELPFAMVLPIERMLVR